MLNQGIKLGYLHVIGFKPLGMKKKILIKKRNFTKCRKLVF